MTAFFVITALLICLDQLTKYLAWRFLRPVSEIPLIPGVFELEYVENRGAAFGLFEDRQILFVIFAVVVAAGCGWYYHSLKGRKDASLLRLVCCMLSAGAVGNMLDRIRLGYVIDFLYVSLIDFPVFNVADILVCVSCFLLIILLFFGKDSGNSKDSGKP